MLNGFLMLLYRQSANDYIFWIEFLFGNLWRRITQGNFCHSCLYLMIQCCKVQILY